MAPVNTPSSHRARATCSAAITASSATPDKGAIERKKRNEIKAVRPELPSSVRNRKFARPQKKSPAVAGLPLSSRYRHHDDEDADHHEREADHFDTREEKI